MKRFLSLILVVTLLVSMLTGVIMPASAATGASYYYNMGRLQTGQWSDNGVSPEVLTGWDSLGKLGNFYNRTSDPFMFHGKEGNINLAWNSSSPGNPTEGYLPRGTAITGEVGASYTLAIRVGSNGLYTPYAQAADTTTSSQFNFYLAPMGVANPKAEMYYLGTSTADSTDIWSVSTWQYNNQYLPEGDYLLTIEIAQLNEGSKSYGYFSGFGLTRVADVGDSALVLYSSIRNGYVGSEEEIDISTTFNSSGTTVPNLDQFRIDTLNSNIATVREAGGVYYLCGVSAGSTVLRISACEQGKANSIDYPITIKADDIKYFYNFFRAYYGPWSSSAYAPEYFTDFGMEIKGMPNGNAPPIFWDESSPWKFGGKSAGFVATSGSSFKTVGWSTTGSPGDWINMIIRVPESGVYRIGTLIHTIVAGCCYRMYVSPVGTPESEQRNEKYYVGDVECADAASTSGVVRLSRNVTLAAADYNVVYELKKGATVGNGGSLGGIYLKETPNDQFRLFANDPDLIMETTDSVIPISAFFNGTEMNFSKIYNLGAVSADPSVATASVQRVGDGASVVIHGVAPGKTTVTFSARLGSGKGAQYTVNVAIAPKKQIRTVELTAPKYALNPGDSVQSVLSGTCFDGSQIDFSEVDVYYENSNGAVISVDENGLITAKEKGSSTVTVWIKQGETIIQNSKVFTVGTYSGVSVELVMPEVVQNGGIAKLATKVRLLSGVEVEPSRYTVSYRVTAQNPANCVQLNGDRVFARRVGTASITATVTIDGAQYTAVKSLEIVQELPESEHTITEVVLDLRKTELYLGEFTMADVGVRYDNGWLVSYDPATMNLTYDEEILRYGDGRFTAIGAGETEITIEANGMKKTATITVFDETLASATVELDRTMYVGKTANAVIRAFSTGGKEIGREHFAVSYGGTSNRNVAGISDTGVVTALGVGEATISITVSIGENVVNAVLSVTVLSDGVESIQVSATSTAMKPNDTTGVQISANTVSALGVVAPAAAENLSFENLTPDILVVDASGKVLPRGINGKGVVRVTYNANGSSVSSEIEIIVKSGKTESTFFTAERRAAVQENVANYEWAQASYASALELADKWVGREDELLEFITTQELPRGIWATYRYDPEYMICKYCGEDAIAATGAFYPWTIDNETNPWKVQCPLCQRVFPSNDFKAFYDTGINEEGNWSYALAKKNGSHLLTNDLYPEKGEGWGVDDGYGYKTGRTFVTSYGVWDETYTWIAYWNHWGSWSGVDPMFGITCRATVDLAYGYAYSGNKEYGRTLAILIDRVADVYPDLDTGVYEPQFYNSGWYGGRATGGIWETALTGQLATVYDAAFDMYDDPYVMEYIQNRAEKLGIKTPKNSPEEVRQHIEDHLLREIFKGIQDKRIWGNEGMYQDTAVMTAVCLDNMPESKEWIDWATTGAEGVLNKMINTVDREGQGDENSPQYNNGWVASYANMARWLGGYKNYPAANFYINPKYNKMLKMNLPLTMTRNHTLQIGDSGGFATLTWHFGPVYMGEALANGSNDPELAQFLYFLNGNTAKGINGTSLMVSAKALEEKISSLVEEYGEYDFDKSTQMPAYGAAVLRDGTLTEEENTQHAVSLWYGSTAGHAGADTLSITLSAYGLDFMPAFGYPSNTSGTGDIVNWERGTIGKNTVQVNGKNQKISDSRTIDKIGDPIHFDDSEMVKVADGRNNWVYKDEGVEEYRRTEVMVEVGNGDSYTVDFFRIKGGYEHVYSFHGNSNEIYDYDRDALNPQKQTMGTYAGPGVPYGPGNIKSGQDGLYDVQRTVYPESKSFWVDLKIDDFRDVLPGERDLHLRMTQVNDFALSDVSFASGRPPRPYNNPKEIKYVLAKRTGTNLDSLFTTVLEPYDTTRFIKRIDPVEAVRISGNGKDDQVKAVKVTLKDGRVDYIVYAANNKLRYRIDDKFNFQGFIGVISYRYGRPVYRYLHDGNLIDTMHNDAQATGYVVDFTKDLAFENDIKVKLAQNVPASELVGKTVHVKNGGGNHTGKRNGSFWIRGAEKNSDGTYTLHLGNTTLITSVSNGVYTHGIAEDQSLSIPLTSEWMTTKVGVQTINGAQVRIRGVQGLRFISTIDKANPNFADAVEFGTLLIPSDDITDISEVQIGAVLNGHAVARVPAKNLYAETANEITFTAVLTGLTEPLYTREFTARAYAIMKDGSVVYADAGASRSIYSVAKRAVLAGTEERGVLSVLRNIVALVEDLDDNDAPDPWK